MGHDNPSIFKSTFKIMLKYRYESKKNKYVNRSRISEKKFREIIKYFSLDLNAVQIKELTGLSRQTINKYLTAIRLRIVELSILQSAPLVSR